MNPVANGSTVLYPFSVKRKRRQLRRSNPSAIELLAAIIALLICMYPSIALTEDDFLPFQQYVRYNNNDNVSLALTNVRASDAVQLMRSATGVRITLPTPTQSKTITLAVDRARMDQAIESLLTALDLDNSFLVYDRDGHLTGVIALDKGKTQSASNSQPPEENEQQKSEYKNLTAPEREALVREFRLWSKLSAKDRDSIHARLKTIPPSKQRDDLIKEYVRLVLGVRELETETTD
jgi:hypothetical protein